MHLSEGVLSPPVLVAGAVLTAGGVGIGLRQTEAETVPKVAVLGSAFFVASFIHVPVGPTNVHLVLNGLTGLILGWAAFPAILVALTLQALLFQFGGITVLGVNTFNMAFPALVCYYLFSPLLGREETLWVAIGGAAAGALGILMSGLLMALSLMLTGRSFLHVAQLALLAHMQVMIMEGILSAFGVLFLKKLRPEMLPCRSKPRPVLSDEGELR